MKTSKEVERDFFAMVKDSKLGKAIKGDVYRFGMRPVSPTTEDIVIKFLTGKSVQVQNGIVILNIYVPDIPYKGTLVENIPRGEDLEKHVHGLVRSMCGGDYYVYLDETPSTIAVDDIHQHCISVSLNFKVITD